MNFFTGFLIGVVSLIPGISGGTILVLMKKYDTIAHAITHFRQKENALILFFLILGIILGTITFAKIIELLFYFVPDSTMILFSGFVLFNIPNLIKEEKIKPNIFWLCLGFTLIFLLSCLNNHSTPITLHYPQINILFLIYFTFCGAIDGFFTILPGISGSMIMMILGPYYLYKSFLAHLSINSLIFLLPLLFYFIGDVFGFFIGSKFSLYFLKKHRKKFMSLILGMVCMSAIIILPIPTWQFKSILLYIIPLLISYLICQLINLFN